MLARVEVALMAVEERDGWLSAAMAQRACSAVTGRDRAYQQQPGPKQETPSISNDAVTGHVLYAYVSSRPDFIR